MEIILCQDSTNFIILSSITSRFHEIVVETYRNSLFQLDDRFKINCIFCNYYYINCRKWQCIL